MAVAAADFYTYARATGTPLPKTKQEEAQLTPAVDKWKKSRTKAPERKEDSNAIRNVLGTGAIAAQYAAVSCVKLATNTWVLMGNHGGVS